METWEAAEAEWRSLVLRYGAPREARSLSADQFAEAVAESRALAVDVRRDGFGGGDVWFDLARADNAGHGHLHEWFCIAFPSPCVLTADVVRRLNANAWESWGQVCWVTETAELVELLDRLADAVAALDDRLLPSPAGACAQLAARIRSARRGIPSQPVLLDELAPILATVGAWDSALGTSERTLANRARTLWREFQDRRGVGASVPPAPSGPQPVPSVGHAQRLSGSTGVGDISEILREARALLALPGNDFTWSSWGSARDALHELDGLLAALAAGRLPRREAIAVLFAPTGPIQEVSLSSGWGTEFVALAKRLDAALERAYASESTTPGDD